MYASLARSRARRATQYNGNRHVAISREALDPKIDLNRAKTKQLQHISDLSIALGLLCEHFISSITIFKNQTSPVLWSSLQEASSTQGYIDTFRYLITDIASKGNNEHGFIKDVWGACNMRGKPAPLEILKWVETAMRMAHRQDQFVMSAALPRSHSPAQEHSLIASHEKIMKSMQERTVKLLARKIEKADIGYSLKSDTEAILEETRYIVG